MAALYVYPIDNNEIKLMAGLSTKDPNEKINLMETYYCDYSHPLIQEKAADFMQYKSDKSTLIKKIFHFVRDEIVFGGDYWKVKASETLQKSYGACYNKNLLFIALLRASGIQAKLLANPMRKDFMKPAIGVAYLTISNPFMHCFTEVYLDNKWIAVDPTLDQQTFITFFSPLGVAWGIDWVGGSNMILYPDSIVGTSKLYPDIDEALRTNLDSHFLFKHEPDYINPAIKYITFMQHKIFWDV
jgi:transglutaminase-like putative cysteine protease